MGDTPDISTSTGTSEQGLFSLVEAAAISRPIATTREPSDNAWSSGSCNGPSSLGAGPASVGNSSKAHTAMKHRRLSSTGQARRRLSEAREANSRPSPVMLQNAAAALGSLATLSLGSPPPQSNPHTGTSFTPANGVTAATANPKLPKLEVNDEDIVLDDATTPVKPEINGAANSVTKTGKKRGTIFKCESCSKVYRHPSCLIKHRWEHSPHWREASKFLLSKHQQVQLLEAAAILSHLAPSASGGTSLPEDRSLWPSFLSNGLLPPPDQTNIMHDGKSSPKPRASSIATSLDQTITYPVSSSLPATSLLSSSSSAPSTRRSPSAGPRMHNYAIPSSGSITQVRPGVVGVPTNSCSQSDAPAVSVHSQSSNLDTRSAPVPVPTVSRDAYREPRDPADGTPHSFVSAASVSDTWSSPVSVGFAQSSFRSSVGSAPYAPSGIGRSLSDGAGGWSLPRSSLRSSSLSRSGSGSVGMDEGDEFVDVDSASVGASEDSGFPEGTGRFGFRSRGWKNQLGNGKIDEEEWDGMEMEMEM